MRVTDLAIMEALEARAPKESLRSVSQRLGISHVALWKRLKRLESFREGFGEFDATDVQIIVAVARAGIPGGLTELARYMECGLLDILEVCRAFGVPCKDDDPGEGDPDQDEDEEDDGGQLIP
jgi:hypothetical protein